LSRCFRAVSYCAMNSFGGGIEPNFSSVNWIER
jgi:hypothetical protein